MRGWENEAWDLASISPSTSYPWSCIDTVLAATAYADFGIIPPDWHPVYSTIHGNLVPSRTISSPSHTINTFNTVWYATCRTQWRSTNRCRRGQLMLHLTNDRWYIRRSSIASDWLSCSIDLDFPFPFPLPLDFDNQMDSRQYYHQVIQLQSSYPVLS